MLYVIPVISYITSTNTTVTFGLRKDIHINDILGITQLKEWRMVLDLGNKYSSLKGFPLWSPLHFDDAASGMPSNIQFIRGDFKRLAQHNPIGEISTKKWQIQHAVYHSHQHHFDR